MTLFYINVISVIIYNMVTILGKRQRKAKRFINTPTIKESLIVEVPTDKKYLSVGNGMDITEKIVLSFVGLFASTYFYFAIIVLWGVIRGG